MVRVLVDPMLGPEGAAAPATLNQRRRPLMNLPFGKEEMAEQLAGIRGVLVSHAHADH